jgi:hypothetical protein
MITKRKIKKFLCFIGRHCLKEHTEYFTDKVSGKMVYLARCQYCSKIYLTDTKSSWFGFRIKSMISANDFKRGLFLRS